MQIEMRRAISRLVMSAMLFAPILWAAELEDPIPKPIEKAGPEVFLQPIAKGFTAPNWGTSAPGHPDRLVVTDQPGILWSIDLETGEKSVFADLSGLLVELGIRGPDSFDERGLLGVAFHPRYKENGLLYTYTSEPTSGTPANGISVPSATYLSTTS